MSSKGILQAEIATYLDDLVDTSGLEIIINLKMKQYVRDMAEIFLVKKRLTPDSDSTRSAFVLTLREWAKEVAEDSINGPFYQLAWCVAFMHVPQVYGNKLLHSFESEIRREKGYQEGHQIYLFVKTIKKDESGVATRLVKNRLTLGEFLNRRLHDTVKEAK